MDAQSRAGCPHPAFVNPSITVLTHLTFAWPASVWSAQRCYEKFMKREMWGVSYFYALEQNPGRDGFHVHALWCDCKNKSHRDLWQKWFARYGRNRIEPVNCAMDVSDYCAKYVTKEGAWRAVNLVGYRHPKLKDFKLVHPDTMNEGR